jgi:hypothetical protein
MNSTQRQYLFGLLFFCAGLYQAYIHDYLEFSLFAVAGLAFAVNALTFEPKLLKHKKLLVVISWILIITTGILFLYLLQFKGISWR